MPTTLTKIIVGKPAVPDELTNDQTVKCPRCEQTYRLGFSDGEWHRVRAWLQLAETAIRKDHNLRHETATIPLEWRGYTETVSRIRRRRGESGKMINVYWSRGKIGDAVWLWMALNGAVQQPNMGNEWFPVLQSDPIGDSQVGQAVFADEETVIAWRSRLESLGLVRTTPLPDKDALGLPCRKYEVLNLNFGVSKVEPALVSTLSQLRA